MTTILPRRGRWRQFVCIENGMVHAYVVSCATTIFQCEFFMPTTRCCCCSAAATNAAIAIVSLPRSARKVFHLAGKEECISRLPPFHQKTYDDSLRSVWRISERGKQENNRFQGRRKSNSMRTIMMAIFLGSISEYFAKQILFLNP